MAKQCFQHLGTRAKGVSTNQQSLHKELEHIKKALQVCSFTPWALNSLQHKFNCNHNIHNEQNSTDNQPNNNSGTITTTTTHQQQEHLHSGTIHPWTRGEVQKDMQQQGIQVHFKATSTTETLIMAPKDWDSKLQKCGVIYKFKCQHLNCPEEYIGESGRTFGDRLKEHLRAHPPS